MDLSSVLSLLEFLARFLMGPLFFAVGCVPFVVWAGKVTRTSTAARNSGLPGPAAIFWFCLLPLALFIYVGLRGLDVPDPANPYAEDEWGQVLSLFLVPASGWLFGFVVGVLVGESERERV